MLRGRGDPDVERPDATRPASRLARALVGGAPLVAAALIAFAACSDDADTVAEPAGPPAAGSFATTECGACFTTACAAELAACQTDPDCARRVDCTLRCPADASGNPDPACVATCPASANEEAAALEAALDRCRSVGAGFRCAACGRDTSTLGAILDQECPAHEPAPTACRECYWDRCCVTWDACYAEGVNPDCDALASCIMVCSEPYEPCVAACFAAHPNSVATLLAQISCGLSRCAMDQVDCDESRRDPCEECLYGDCQNPFVTLLSTAEGYLAWFCMSDCGAAGAGSECVEACIEAHPDAEDDSLAWAACIESYCGSVC